MTSTLDKQHNVRIDKKIYNNFVHESNYKSDLVIAPANTSIIPVISDGHALTKDVGSSITFNTTTTPGLLYSNYIEIGATVHVVANNVKVKEDTNMTAECIRNITKTSVSEPRQVYYFKTKAMAAHAWNRCDVFGKCKTFVLLSTTSIASNTINRIAII